MSTSCPFLEVDMPFFKHLVNSFIDRLKNNFVMVFLEMCISGVTNYIAAFVKKDHDK